MILCQRRCEGDGNPQNAFFSTEFSVVAVVPYGFPDRTYRDDRHNRHSRLIKLPSEKPIVFLFNANLICRNFPKVVGFRSFC